MAEMSKRPRTEEAAPPSALAVGPAPGEARVTGALAGWCNDRLVEVAESYIGDEDQDGCMNSKPHVFAQYMDDQFEDFLEALQSEQGLAVSETAKGAVAKAWRECATDVARILLFRCAMDPGSQFMGNFCGEAEAQSARQALSVDTDETFERWYFDLGWRIAEVILSISDDASSSGDDDNEPVNESDSDEESEDDSKDGSVTCDSSNSNDSDDDDN